MKNMTLGKCAILPLIAMILAMAPSVKAQAAPKVMPDGTVFDAEFYADRYPDVVAALGRSEEAMYRHYKQYGRAEGRLPYASAAVSVTTTVPANASAYDKIVAMKSEFPEGMEWDYDNFYRSPNRKRDTNVGLNASACQAFAYIVFDRIWGTDVYVHYRDMGLLGWMNRAASSLGPGTHVLDINDFINSGVDFNTYKNQYWSQIRSGDLLSYGGHIVVVLSNNGNSLTVCEGNYDDGHGGRIHWFREISKDYLFSFPYYCVETCTW